MLGLPRPAFDLMDLVYFLGRPLACWLQVNGERRRLTVVSKSDIETGEVYGIAIRLAPVRPPAD